MKVLLTGAFGNIGGHTLTALVRKGHQIRCFDMPTKANRRAARRAMRQYGDQVSAGWGDVRRREDVVRAVVDQDAIVHLAFIIPK